MARKQSHSRIARRSSRWSLPGTRSATVQVGAGRTLIAGAILAAPVPAARLLGADTATAQRVTWLTRMMGVRDGVLGVGTLGSAYGRGGPGWLVGGAVSDAVDAVVVAQAIKQGRMRGFVPNAIVVGAGGSAAWHVLTAIRLRRSRR